jgi:predicted phosphate transport protein (TIGR00153 family)
VGSGGGAIRAPSGFEVVTAGGLGREDVGPMPRISLVPQNREFFHLLSNASANAVGISRQLVALLEGFPANGDRLSEIKTLEHEGDRLTREVVDLLNRTFVTPFDRDDIYNLATAIDDVCDHVDEAAGDIVGFGVVQVRPKATEQARVILRSAEQLDEAVKLLDGFKDSSDQLRALRDLEDEGDRLNREAVSDLFASETDPIAVIRWKDIHEQLEEAVDACENAADVLEAILVKNR